MKKITLFTFLVLLSNICFASFPVTKSQTETFQNLITMQSIDEVQNNTILQKTNFFKFSLKFLKKVIIFLLCFLVFLILFSILFPCKEDCASPFGA
ncbi:hypothetical protein OAR04_01815 [Flavobacteriales bacterium]|nr:hypothetical protein [Flavobacteriales bacterium]